ncbi:MAG: hypothetical protein NXI28_15230 [bacterium]|nr:hypothetical protein [bacterium]
MTQLLQQAQEIKRRNAEEDAQDKQNAIKFIHEVAIRDHAGKPQKHDAVELVDALDIAGWTPEQYEKLVKSIDRVTRSEAFIQEKARCMAEASNWRMRQRIRMFKAKLDGKRERHEARYADGSFAEHAVENRTDELRKWPGWFQDGKLIPELAHLVPDQVASLVAKREAGDEKLEAQLKTELDGLIGRYGFDAARYHESGELVRLSKDEAPEPPKPEPVEVQAEPAPEQSKRPKTSRAKTPPPPPKADDDLPPGIPVT